MKISIADLERAESIARARIVDGGGLSIPDGCGAFDFLAEPDGAISMLIRIRVSAADIDAQIAVDLEAEHLDPDDDTPTGETVIADMPHEGAL